MARGRLAEQLAALYLELSGYRILGRNVRCGPLEIDLIARRGVQLALVEVRLRASRRHGRPEESVRSIKRARLARAARAYLARVPPTPGTRVRLDLICVEAGFARLEVRHWMGIGAAPRGGAD